jgi:hypothetical protein
MVTRPSFSWDWRVWLARLVMLCSHINMQALQGKPQWAPYTRSASSPGSTQSFNATRKNLWHAGNTGMRPYIYILSYMYEQPGITWLNQINHRWYSTEYHLCISIYGHWTMLNPPQALQCHRLVSLLCSRPSLQSRPTCRRTTGRGRRPGWERDGLATTEDSLQRLTSPCLVFVLGVVAMEIGARGRTTTFTRGTID